jgi:FKBP-type peptidyl-prolyl cis-trans isomerase FklB
MKIRLTFSLVILSALFFMVSCSQTPDPDKVALKDKNDSISYVIGLDYGTGLQKQHIDYRPAAMFKGLENSLKGQSIIPDSVKRALITEINSQIEQRRQETFNAQLAQNKEAGAKFMKENKDKPGVVELPSGLQYKIINQGVGKTKPSVTDSVVLHYRAMFTDGKLIDETYGRLPTSFRLNKVMKGLSQGIQLMNPGSIYEFYIPSDLAFADKNFTDQNGKIVIPAGSTLIYRVELLNVIR